jgi:hypothetical protein
MSHVHRMMQNIIIKHTSQMILNPFSGEMLQNIQLFVSVDGLRSNFVGFMHGIRLEISNMEAQPKVECNVGGHGNCPDSFHPAVEKTIVFSLKFESESFECPTRHWHVTRTASDRTRSTYSKTFSQDI